MGNPNLVIIINDEAYIIKGVDYDSRKEAIDLAMKKFHLHQSNIEKMQHDENGKLRKDADPHWYPEEIRKLQIYYV